MSDKPKCECGGPVKWHPDKPADFYKKCGGDKCKTPDASKPCYAPSFDCLTHKCGIDTCWVAGRCGASYALNR